MIGLLFRLPPLVYLVLAPLVLALGIYLFIDENGRDAERAAALSHAAPKPIAIQALKSGDTGNDFNEIVVKGQADINNMIEIVRIMNDGDGTGMSAEYLFPEPQLSPYFNRLGKVRVVCFKYG